uniref:Uncharacterized protein n=1 Tax=Anopheles farauti TaxID=69004 RepID=A0A182QFH1_9DIPT
MVKASERHNNAKKEKEINHIRGHQDALAPVTECAEYVIALLLRFVTVDGHRTPSVAIDDACNVVHAPLRLDEDDRLRVRLRRNLCQQLHQLLVFLVVLAHIHYLQDVVVGRQVQRTDVDLDVVGQKLFRQIAHLLRPGGGPHQHLPVGPDLAHYLADLRLKAHVQHAIGAAPQVGDAALKKINQPPRGGNHNFGTPFEVPNLRSLRGPTENTRIVRADARSKISRHLLDLLGKFAGWCQNQSDWTISAPDVGLVLDMYQRRHDVSERLTGSGLCNTNHVTAAKCNRHALRLNGRRFAEALTLQFLHNGHGQSAVLELHTRTGHITTFQRYLMLIQITVNVRHRQAQQSGRRLVEVLLERRQILRLPLYVAKVLAIVRLSVERTPIASAITTSASTIAPEATSHRTARTATLHSSAVETTVASVQDALVNSEIEFGFSSNIAQHIVPTHNNGQLEGLGMQT